MHVVKAKQGLVEPFLKDSSEAKLVEFESKKYLQIEQRMSKDLHEMVEPRQFSIMQIRDLFFSLLHVSKFREAFWDHQEFFIKIKTEISEKIAEFQKLAENQADVNKKFRDDLDKQQCEYKEHVREYYRVLEQDHDALTILKDKQKYIFRELEDNKGF